jgi:hypothetical protein
MEEVEHVQDSLAGELVHNLSNYLLLVGPALLCPENPSFRTVFEGCLRGKESIDTLASFASNSEFSILAVDLFEENEGKN